MKEFVNLSFFYKFLSSKRGNGISLSPTLCFTILWGASPLPSLLYRWGMLQHNHLDDYQKRNMCSEATQSSSENVLR